MLEGLWVGIFKYPFQGQHLSPSPVGTLISMHRPLYGVPPARSPRNSGWHFNNAGAAL